MEVNECPDVISKVLNCGLSGEVIACWLKVINTLISESFITEHLWIQLHMKMDWKCFNTTELW